MDRLRVLSLLLLVALADTHAADLTFTGYARSLDTGALLYVESHAVADAGMARESRVVLYRCHAQSAPFARKQLDFGAERTAPAFALEDARSGIAEGLVRDARGLVVYEKPRGAASRAESIQPDAALVADAGFDEFVRTRWEMLAAGDALVVPFVVPSRLTTVRFKVRRIGTASIDGEAASVFRLSLAGALGWLLPDIDVSYRDRDRRLLRYRGITNLRDVRGNMISAQIDFPDAARAESTVDLAALRALPLVGQCH